MKEFWNKLHLLEIDRKKIIKYSIIAVLLIIFIVLAIVYSNNMNVREWIDKHILRKEVMQDNATIIELKEENPSIYAFDRYIGILNKAKFTIYGNTGSEEKSLDIQISNPIFDSANRFLAIAESKGKKLYLLTDREISWEAEVEGAISQIHVNKNGYVAVVIVDTSYKSVIKMYNSNGKEMFNTYLSSTRAIDVSISNDNKHLAIAEVNTSGTIIQSSVRIVSVDKAETDPTNSIEKTYNSESSKLITNIEYQDKNKLVCMYTDSLTVIENDEEKTLLENDKTIFQSIELNNHACSVKEKSSGLFTADSEVNIVDVDGNNLKQYTVDSVAKEIYTYGNNIALNLGTEIEFINTDGWLVKRYIANQEITNVVISSSVAGIIYRDKIEIINL